MPIKSDPVSLLVNGQAQARWDSYAIHADLLIPADAWEFSLAQSTQQLPASIVPGAAVQVQIGNDTVLTGLIDDIDESLSMGEHHLSISGRDYGGLLTDCSAPLFTEQQVGLEDVVVKIISAFGIHNVAIKATSAGTFQKVSTEPGEAAWDLIQRLAEANGLWPWFEPDGTLVIGGADYSVPVSADLILRYSGKGNNIKALNRRRSIVDRFSEITVLGQSAGNAVNDGNAAILAIATDTSVGTYRPKIIMDSDADTADIAKKRARKLLMDGRLNGIDLQICVQGHRVSNDGALWTPGMRVHLVSEPHGIDDIFFLMGRSFVRSLNEGTITQLRLKEDGVWTLDALPEKQAKKVGNKSPALHIMDTSQ